MEIKICKSSEILPLRMSVLRPGRPIEEGMFPGDEDVATFHLGLYENGKLTSIASFYKENKEGIKGEGYRLRSMATDPPFQGKGYGKRILDFGIEELRSRNIDYLWCNARTTAMGFYRHFGFEVISEEFEIPTIGPHYELALQLKQPQND
jgi:GNAT superfamily N-acetyltransferase